TRRIPRTPSLPRGAPPYRGIPAGMENVMSQGIQGTIPARWRPAESREAKMTRRGDFLIGILTGAGLMFLLDPARGPCRRALIRDYVVHGTHEREDFSEDLAWLGRHARDRTRGVFAEFRLRSRSDNVDEDVLAAPV